MLGVCALINAMPTNSLQKLKSPGERVESAVHESDGAVLVYTSHHQTYIHIWYDSESCAFSFKAHRLS